MHFEHKLFGMEIILYDVLLQGLAHKGDSGSVGGSLGAMLIQTNNSDDDYNNNDLLSQFKDIKYIFFSFSVHFLFNFISSRHT